VAGGHGHPEGPAGVKLSVSIQAEMPSRIVVVSSSAFVRCFRCAFDRPLMRSDRVDRVQLSDCSVVLEWAPECQRRAESARVPPQVRRFWRAVAAIIVFLEGRCVLSSRADLVLLLRQESMRQNRLWLRSSPLDGSQVAVAEFYPTAVTDGARRGEAGASSHVPLHGLRLDLSPVQSCRFVIGGRVD
jgi:hypothetical protein